MKVHLQYPEEATQSVGHLGPLHGTYPVVMYLCVWRDESADHPVALRPHLEHLAAYRLRTKLHTLLMMQHFPDLWRTLHMLIARTHADQPNHLSVVIKELEKKQFDKLTPENHQVKTTS